MYSERVYSNAKLNIGLNILNKREDNYHNIDSIMVPIDLFDIMEIFIYNESGNLEIETSSKDVPLDEKNIIYKVYNIFYKKLKIEKKKIKVKLIKNIPIFSGLGGGSSNGALFLKILNKYHNDILSVDDMLDLSKNVGADIPFFIYNTSARVTGIGEKIKIIKNNLKSEIILIKPNFGISTKEAYENFSNIQNIKYANIEKIIEGLENDNIELVENNIENVLEQSISKNKYIENFKKEFLYSFKDIKIYMSGSGSCFYIFNKNKENLEIKIKEKFKNLFIKSCKLV